VLTQLPWIMVPALLVPFYLLIHLAVAAKLSEQSRIARVGRHTRTA
jgi:hypothetical protein